MVLKNLVTVLLSAWLWCLVMVAPSWAINVSSGERVELKATSSLGVPLHRTSSSSLIGRAPDGSIVEVVGTVKDQDWVEIKLPNGQERWIVERYISRVLSSNTDGADVNLPEVTTLVSGENKLSVAAFNVKNLDSTEQERFLPLGQLIVKNLQSPDIIVLTEIQDNDGSLNSTTTDATETYNKLIDAIKQVEGPNYIAFDIAPERNKDGGQPGGNIRVGYLYQPARVALVQGKAGGATEKIKVLDGPRLSLNPGRIDPNNAGFNDSRKPLAAEFQFKNNPVFIVGNHFVSKRNDNDAKRETQARLVGNFVKELLEQNPQANAIVAGDLNDLNDSETIEILKETGLKNLSELLEPSDRYTYKFRNRLQQLDYILVSENLAQTGKFDIVHVNVNQPKALSDHDPVLAQFSLSNLESGNESVFSEVIFPELSGETLRSRLARDYGVKKSLGYDKARDYMYSQLDNNDGVVRGIYSNFAVEVDPQSKRPRSEAFQNGKGINAEHSWPQSKGAKGVAKSDLHHLFPSRANVNSRRGSSPFAEIEDTMTDRWLIDDLELRTIPSTNIDAYSEATSSNFEPREAVKGNIARALFYFYTVYKNQAEPGFFEKQQTTLCDWNVLDPIDAEEISRSRAIATQQGNDNPFVIDPTLANRLYCTP